MPINSGGDSSIEVLAVQLLEQLHVEKRMPHSVGQRRLLVNRPQMDN